MLHVGVLIAGRYACSQDFGPLLESDCVLDNRQKRLGIGVLVDDVPDHRRFDHGLHGSDLSANGSGQDGSGPFTPLFGVEVRILLIGQERGRVSDGFRAMFAWKSCETTSGISEPIWLRTRRTISLSACGTCSATMAPWSAR